MVQQNSRQSYAYCHLNCSNHQDSQYNMDAFHTALRSSNRHVIQLSLVTAGSMKTILSRFSLACNVFGTSNIISITRTHCNSQWHAPNDLTTSY